MAWGKAGSKTLTSAGELTDITLSANKCNSFMNHNVTMSANNDVIIQFNNDTENNYADRLERNGTENTTGSNGDIRLVPSGGAFGSFIVGFYANVESEEKLMILSSMQSNTGAGNAPDRDAGVGKWANTSAQITEADITTTSTATLGADSNFTALGSEITPAAAIPFAANAQLGSRAEITDTRKMYYYSDPLTFESDFSSASGWTASDSNDIGVANGKLNWYNNGTNTYENAYYDLGSVSDTKWILRHTLKVSGTPSSDEIPYQFIISNTANANWNTSSSCLGVWVYVDRNNAWRRIYTANKVNSTSGGDNGAQASPRYWSDFAYGTTYYITTTRTSATNMTVEIRTGSHSGSIVSNGTLTLTIPSGITGLRYLTANQGAQGTGLSMEVDDVEFYNGVTSV